MSQMKKLSHVTVRISVFSMSRMILTKNSRHVQSRTIGQKGTFRSQSLGCQTVPQHIQDLFPMLFDYLFKHLTNFTPIPRHAFNFELSNASVLNGLNRNLHGISLKAFISNIIYV